MLVLRLGGGRRVTAEPSRISTSTTLTSLLLPAGMHAHPCDSRHMRLGPEPQHAGVTIRTTCLTPPRPPSPATYSNPQHTHASTRTSTCVCGPRRQRAEMAPLFSRPRSTRMLDLLGRFLLRRGRRRRGRASRRDRRAPSPPADLLDQLRLRRMRARLERARGQPVEVGERAERALDHL